LLNNQRNVLLNNQRNPLLNNQRNPFHRLQPRRQKVKVDSWTGHHEN
jgi:hypothetical protein